MKKTNQLKQLVSNATAVDSLTPLFIGLLIFATALIIVSCNTIG